MNILFITSWYPSKLDATNGNFVERHARALLSEGHRVVVAHEAFSNKFPIPSIVREGSDELPVFQIYMPRLLKKSMFFRRLMARRLLKCLSNSGFYFEIIHGHVIHPVGRFAAYISQQSGIPFVFTEHWSGFLPTNAGKLSEAQLNEIRQSASLCKTLMPVSENLAASMKTLSIQAPYRVVYNAVDTSIYYSKPEKRSPTFTFLHVSNFAKGVKNVEGIINAFAALRAQSQQEVALVIAGDGDLDSIRHFMTQKHDGLMGVNLMGTQTYAGVAALMQSSHCFVLFSNYENLPCVIAESNCCGIPVIATSVGGVPEMIDDTNGLLVDARDEVQLVEAMQRVVRNYTSFNGQSIQHAARLRYGYSTIAAQFEEVYRKALHPG